MIRLASMMMLLTLGACIGSEQHDKMDAGSFAAARVGNATAMPPMVPIKAPPAYSATPGH